MTNLLKVHSLIFAFVSGVLSTLCFQYGQTEIAFVCGVLGSFAGVLACLSIGYVEESTKEINKPKLPPPAEPTVL